MNIADPLPDYIELEYHDDRGAPDAMNMATFSGHAPLTIKIAPLRREGQGK